MKAGGKSVRAQASYDPNPKTVKEAIEFVVMANRILANEGMFDALGHVSLRNPKSPNTFFIARSIAPALVTKDDILEVDLDGNIVTKTTMRPYLERIIHAGILKARPDVNAAVHAHPLPLVTFSVVDLPLRPLAHSGAMFYEGVPVYDEYDFTGPGATGMLVTTKEEGDRVARVLGKSRAMLMRGHGCNVVGESIPSVVLATIALCTNAVIQMNAVRLGEPKYLAAEEARGRERSAVGEERAWSYYVARAKKAMRDLR
jgi:3-hydroxy-2-methylpyridine-4,5-dicarboxylate 4-decarboxylase